jgi:hypothetical protein
MISKSEEVDMINNIKAINLENSIFTDLHNNK